MTTTGRPIDLAMLRNDKVRKWSRLVPDPVPPIYAKPFTCAYGLYSRHGRFYPHYNVVPDVNWSEMLDNL